MVEGIENSDIIVVFITDTYRDKINSGSGRDNCLFEFKHAFEQKGPEVMIPVVMEPCMRDAREWTELLGAALSTHLHVDFSSAFTDDALFDAKVNELVTSIAALLASSSLSHGAITRSPPPKPVTAGAMAHLPGSHQGSTRRQSLHVFRCQIANPFVYTCI